MTLLSPTETSCRNNHTLGSLLLPSHQFLVGLLPVGNISIRNVSLYPRVATGKTIQIDKSVHLRILHVLPDLLAHDIDLLLRVSQGPREKGISEGFEALHYLEVIPSADLFLQKRTPEGSVSGKS